MFKKIDPKMNLPKMEEGILEYWEKEKIFEKSVNKESPKGDFVFYEGPPTANGKPGLHHVLARSFKDIIPRYKTMKGYRVQRKAGWDTHGLPVELQVEKALGLRSKQEIENIVPDDERASIIEFNKKCKESVWEYRDIWEKLTRRMGYWVDMEHPYVTYENGYIESVWWQLAQVAKLKNAKGESFLYKGHKVVPYCYRCGTALSSHEVAQGYKEVKDNSVYVKFKAIAGQKIGDFITDDQTYFLAWTTTPWTLPGNVALAVSEDVEYGVVNIDGEEGNFILAEDCIERVMAGKKYAVLKKISGKELIGKSYRPIFEQFLDNNEKLLNENGDGKKIAACVAVRDGKVLMGLREYTKDKKQSDFKNAEVKDFWIVPGGRSELGETFFDTLKREMKEEVNIEKFSIKKYLGGVDGYLEGDLVKWFLLDVDDFDQIQNNEPHKFKEWKFLGLDEMPKDQLMRVSDLEYFKQAVQWNNAYKIYPADFVTTDSGTGIVHIAPAFGEDDANVAKEYNLPTLLTVEADGTMKKGFELPGEGIPVKKLNDKNRYAVDDLIIENLKKRNLFFNEEAYAHEYPFCWRCDTPLIYYAKPSWFIRMSELREELVKNNEAINWVPEHIKDGRFGEWLTNVKDWAISRERYWGTPLPIWECVGTKVVPSAHSGVPENSFRTEERGCGRRKIIESLRELKELSGKKLEDAHKPYVDEVEFPCECGGMMWRVPEVLDVWFDSGAMPLAQLGYPLSMTEKDKRDFEEGKLFPADYICEAIDQTRGWFYTLHAVANLLAKAGVIREGRAYKNVICLEFILDVKGKKMSKSKGNVIDPFEMLDQFGADQLRWYLFSINQPWISKHFDVKGVRDVQNRVFRMLWNSYVFFATYAEIDKWEPKVSAIASSNLLDRWILSELQVLVKDVDTRLDAYDVYGSTAVIETFIDNLSNWYIRRSRKRFWKNENDSDKEQSYQTLYEVLVTLAKLMAPFTPFLAEEMYRNLTPTPHPGVPGSSPRAGEQESSVHLADFPVANKEAIDEKLNENMKALREIVTIGLQKRSEAKIKVRQPLGESRIRNQELDEDFLEIICEELNVKRVFVDASLPESIVLDTTITPELALEGEAREIIRAIQEGRKKAGFNVEDRIVLGYNGKEKVFETFGEMIAKEVLATTCGTGELKNAEYSEEVSIEGEKFIFWLKRI